MPTIHILLATAVFLCSLVAGFLFTFAAVIMPGIAKLDDRSFLSAFKAIDGVIQKNQPLFAVVWLGSVLALVISAVLALWQLERTALLLTIAALFIYVLGVQLPTIIVNIPLNNRLQALDLNTADAQAVRESFERRWNRWNRVRTAFAALTTILLIITLLMI